MKWGLYLILDSLLFGDNLIDAARELVELEVPAIQLRVKDREDREFARLALAIREITRGSGTLFIVNDRLDMALVSDADGLHLGQDDLPISLARRILGKEKIIGLSTHSLGEAVQAEALGADYIGLGPIFKTSTKPHLEPKGVALIKEVRKRVKIPIVAIGGINEENVGEVLTSGADGVALASCLAKAKDLPKTVKIFLGVAKNMKEEVCQVSPI